MTTEPTSTMPPPAIFEHLYLHLWEDTVRWARRGNNAGSRSMRMSVSPIKKSHNICFPDDIRDAYHNDHDEKDYIMDFLADSWGSCAEKVPAILLDETWISDSPCFDAAKHYVYKAFLNYCRKRARNTNIKASKHISLDQLPEELHPMTTDSLEYLEEKRRIYQHLLEHSTPEELVILGWLLKDISTKDALLLLGVTSERTLTRKKDAALKRWATIIGEDKWRN